MAETFTTLERDGWSRNAGAYANVILVMTSQAFVPVLDTFGDLSGKRLLDIASGTGHFAQAAFDRGALVEGLDISADMVALAKRRFPDIVFKLGSAESLPYPDGSFDAVTCCFGLLHMERPEAVIAEIHRVLRSGGRFTYTTWQDGAHGGRMMDMMLKVFQKHGNMDVGLPPSPPMFRFSDKDLCNTVLSDAGFTQIKSRDLDIRWRAKRAEDIETLLKEGMVRIRLVFERQTPAVQETILRALHEETRAFSGPNGVEIPNAAFLATALKP
ncbi:MAG: class I SAM-dependent methyltransferase [Parvibaculaceae bacterium]|jgi:ubiquinone/menaquinone biosynthesis C-methylase UbiE